MGRRFSLLTVRPLRILSPAPAGMSGSKQWVASKRDTGIPLSEALVASRRVFALDMPWHDAIFRAMATLVYRAPPAELHQAMEAACLVHLLL
jgi:hypothetical protein